MDRRYSPLFSAEKMGDFFLPKLLYFVISAIPPFPFFRYPLPGQSVRVERILRESPPPPPQRMGFFSIVPEKEDRSLSSFPKGCPPPHYTASLLGSRSGGFFFFFSIQETLSSSFPRCFVDPTKKANFDIRTLFVSVPAFSPFFEELVSTIACDCCFFTPHL